jgi:hypothetical protein
MECIGSIFDDSLDQKYYHDIIPKLSLEDFIQRIKSHFKGNYQRTKCCSYCGRSIKQEFTIVPKMMKPVQVKKDYHLELYYATKFLGKSMCQICHQRYQLTKSLEYDCIYCYKCGFLRPIFLFCCVESGIIPCSSLCILCELHNRFLQDLGKLLNYACCTIKLLQKTFNKHQIHLSLNLTPHDLIEQYTEQEGKCALSKIEMTFESIQFSNNDFIIKLMDPSAGYMKDNIQLIRKKYIENTRHFLGYLLMDGISLFPEDLNVD